MGTVVFYFSVILVLEASIFFAAEKKAAAKNLASKFIIIKNYAGDRFYGKYVISSGGHSPTSRNL